MGEIIKEGDHVVLVKIFDSSNMKILPVIKGTTVHYGKLHFNPDALIGSQFGSIFEISANTMTQVNNFENYDNELSSFVSNKMSSFEGRSQFSQEKMIRNKKRRCHSNVVTVMKPTLLHINEMLFARDKIGGLRADVLAQIMTLSNIQSGSKCLLLDHNLGMITSAVMSRIIPDGVCIQVLPDYEVLQTTRKTVNMLNVKETDCKDSLGSITVRDLYKLSNGSNSFDKEDEILQGRSEDQTKRLTNRLVILKSGNEEDAKRIKLDDGLDVPKIEQLLKDIAKKDKHRKHRHGERKLAVKHLVERSFDALIIVVQHDHPLPVLKLLLPFIAPSRQFVIYSDLIDPLIECHQYLKSNCLAVSVQLSESWLRRHQVLPDRTRPDMNVTGYGGFLLSGMKALYGVSADQDCDMTLDENPARTSGENV